MKKNISYIIIILIAITSSTLFYHYKTDNKIINSDTKTNPGYTNSNLGISFSSSLALFERNSNGFVKISNFNDPHFYSNVQCSETYDGDNCYGIEIQKAVLEGQNKNDIV